MAFQDQAVQQGLSFAAQMTASAIRSRRPTRKELEAIEEADRPALREAEAALARHKAMGGGGEPEDGPPRIPGNLFDDVEGHEGVKKLLRAALNSDRPVHVLLVGPPGSGKTQLLQGIARLPRSRYGTGPTLSTSGLFSYLLEHPNTRVLAIDELDKADPTNLYLLLTLMESGKITRLQHRAIEEEKRTVWVFAAANTVEPLPEPLLSRFVRIDLPAYTIEESRQITESVLVKREGMAPAQAKAIAAQAAARGSRDPRDGVQIGRLSKGQPGQVGALTEQVIPSKR
jgi:Holliday junction DNA helicase RuvB